MIYRTILRLDPPPAGVFSDCKRAGYTLLGLEVCCLECARTFLQRGEQADMRAAAFFGDAFPITPSISQHLHHKEGVLLLSC